MESLCLEVVIVKDLHFSMCACVPAWLHVCVCVCLRVFVCSLHLLIHNADGSSVFSRFPFLFQNSKKLQPTASNCFQCCWSPCAHWGCRRRRGGGRSGIFIFVRPSNTLWASPGTHSLHLKVAICNDRHFHQCIAMCFNVHFCQGWIIQEHCVI